MSFSFTEDPGNDYGGMDSGVRPSHAVPQGKEDGVFDIHLQITQKCGERHCEWGTPATPLQEANPCEVELLCYGMVVVMVCVLGRWLRGKSDRTLGSSA